MIGEGPKSSSEQSATGLSGNDVIVVIRADADSGIGLGHVARCLSLAEALVAFGCRVILVSASALPEVLLSKAKGVVDCRVMVNKQDVLQGFVDSLGSEIPDWVVVDSYSIDASWHSVIRRQYGCRLVVIDDLADRSLAADIVVDHNLSPDARAKYHDVIKPGTRILSGPSYALISSGYAAVTSRQPSAIVRSIGIFLGGTDPLGLSGELLRICRTEAAFDGDIELVSTSANANLDSLRRACEGPLNAKLSIDLPDLIEFYQRHDVYIGAGGGSTWERCRCGVPALVVGLADNQRVVLEALGSLGAAMCVYWRGASALSEVSAKLQRMLADHQLRKVMVAASLELVDGNGPFRVAAAMMTSSVTVRSAAIDDAQMMYRWRNHPSVRRVSRDPMPMDFDSHLRWLKSALQSESRHVMIAEINGRGVGVIRYDELPDDTLEVSLYCDPRLTGIGIGSAMLNAGEGEMAGRLGAEATVTAFVVPGNESSERMFERAGFMKRDGIWRKALSPSLARPSCLHLGGCA